MFHLKSFILSFIFHLLVFQIHLPSVVERRGTKIESRGTSYWNKTDDSQGPGLRIDHYHKQTKIRVQWTGRRLDRHR